MAPTGVVEYIAHVIPHLSSFIFFSNTTSVAINFLIHFCQDFYKLDTQNWNCRVKSRDGLNGDRYCQSDSEKAHFTLPQRVYERTHFLPPSLKHIPPILVFLVNLKSEKGYLMIGCYWASAFFHVY